METTAIRDNASLIQSIKAGDKIKYIFFWGHTQPKDGSIDKGCFSQWFPAPFEIDGCVYHTAENYMMAEKARLFEDEATLAKILKTESPSNAKKLGRSVHGFDSEKWDAHRFQIVVKGNVEKFKQNAPLKEYLLKTGDRVIVEASPKDRIWGIGMGQDDPLVHDPENWKGLNLLGYALMEARDLLTY